MPPLNPHNPFPPRRWFCSAETIGLTPAYQREAPQVLGVGTEGHEDKAVQVESFHQDPVVVGGQEVDEEEHRQLAADLPEGKKTRKKGVS